eukprot:gene7776-12250_t
MASVVLEIVGESVTRSQNPVNSTKAQEKFRTSRSKSLPFFDINTNTKKSNKKKPDTSKRTTFYGGSLSQFFKSIGDSSTNVQRRNSFNSISNEDESMEDESAEDFQKLKQKNFLKYEGERKAKHLQASDKLVMNKFENIEKILIIAKETEIPKITLQKVLLGQKLTAEAAEEIKHMKADLIFSLDTTKQKYEGQMKFYDKQVLYYHNEFQEVLNASFEKKYVH